MLTNSQNGQATLQEATLELLKLPRVGLATDIDGTISATAPTPDAAFVSPVAKQALQSLQESGHFKIVSIATGRAATDALALLQLPALTYVGNHGLEILEPHQPVPVANQTAQAYQQTIAQVLQTLKTALQNRQQYEDVTSSKNADVGEDWYKCLLFEDKGITASIHYRLCSDPALARRIILQELHTHVPHHGLHISEGRMVIELRPPLEINKGTALLDLVHLHNLDGLLYLGDDVTDVDAFKALHQLERSRVAPTFRSLAIGVSSPEMPHEVSENSDFLVEGVEGVEHFLTWLVSVA